MFNSVKRWGDDMTILHGERVNSLVHILSFVVQRPISTVQCSVTHLTFLMQQEQ